jgi:hypothetical protein
MVLLTCLIADTDKVARLARYKGSSAIRSRLLCQGKHLQRQHMTTLSAAVSLAGASMLYAYNAELQLQAGLTLPTKQPLLLYSHQTQR